MIASDRTPTTGQDTTARRSRPATSSSSPRSFATSPSRAREGLSTGEKQMYTRAKTILASELMYVLDMDEDEAEAHLEDLIGERPHRAQRRRRDRVSAASRSMPGRQQACRGHGDSLPLAVAVNALEPTVPRRSPFVRPAADRLEPRGACGGLRPRGRGARRRLASRRAIGVEGGGSARIRAQRAGGRAEARTAVVHDAARPFITRDLVEACVGALWALRRRDRGHAGDGHDQGGRRRPATWCAR